MKYLLVFQWPDSWSVGACAKQSAGKNDDCNREVVVAGHATLIEGPGETWWMLYHGYENGYWTLGRQTLLDPVRWTEDGWPEALGGDLARLSLRPAIYAAGEGEVRFRKLEYEAL